MTWQLHWQLFWRNNWLYNCLDLKFIFPAHAMQNIWKRWNATTAFRGQRISWGWHGKFFRCFVTKLKLLQFTRNWYFSNLRKYRFSLVFLARFEELYERPGLPLRGPTSLLEDRISCEGPYLPERGMTYMWEARPPCERLGFRARGLASPWEAPPPSETHPLPVSGLGSM